MLNLKELLHHYLEHQVEVIRRRTQFDLRKAEERAHILEGLRIALDHIDEVIDLIRGSRTTDEARAGLMERFGLTEKQAQAILDMRLQRLTGLEREKIEDEYEELLKTIAELKAILADEARIRGVVRDELLEIREKFADERRTRIKPDADEIDEEDLIPEEEVAVLLTHRGYIKRMPLSTYRAQRRGGRGVTGMGTREDDFVAAPVRLQFPQLSALFLQPGQGVPVEGLRGSGTQPDGPGNPDHQPDPDRARANTSTRSSR